MVTVAPEILIVDLYNAQRAKRDTWLEVLHGIRHIDPRIRFTTSWQLGTESFLVRWESPYSPTKVIDYFNEQRIPWIPADPTAEQHAIFSQLGFMQASILLMGKWAEAEELAELAAIGLASVASGTQQNTRVDAAVGQLQRLLMQTAELERLQKALETQKPRRNRSAKPPEPS